MTKGKCERIAPGEYRSLVAQGGVGVSPATLDVTTTPPIPRPPLRRRYALPTANAPRISAMSCSTLNGLKSTALRPSFFARTML